LKWQPITNGKVLSAKNKALRVIFCRVYGSSCKILLLLLSGCL
jgi:hypothetical protein